MRTLRISWVLSAMAVFGLCGGSMMLAGAETPAKGASITGTVTPRN